MEQIAATQQTVNTEQPIAQPYPPSWVDRLDDWVRRLPLPAWLFYLGVGLALVLIRTIAAWSDGSYPVGTIFPLHVVTASAGVYLLLVLHYLDDRAGAALADFRPVLNVDDAGYERLRYQITTMAARPAFVWSLAGLVVGVAGALFLVSEAQAQAGKLFTSPIASIVDYVVSYGFDWVIVAVLVYHTIHQLRLVSRIYTQYTNVNIFETGPLYALSRVTALTAIALLSIPYLALILGASSVVQWDSPQNVIATGFFMLVALVALVWPLLGAHRLLQESKIRRKSEVARRLEAVTDELHRRADARDYTEMVNMDHAIDGLTKEQSALDKVSTWPWAPETVRAVVTALLLPVALWIVTRVLERLGF
jgi:hypothetical protein